MSEQLHIPAKMDPPPRPARSFAVGALENNIKVANSIMAQEWGRLSVTDNRSMPGSLMEMVVRMMTRAYAQDDHAVTLACWDRIRKHLYPEYAATPPEMPKQATVSPLEQLIHDVRESGGDLQVIEHALDSEENPY